MGFFGAKEGSFTFTSENGVDLRDYQGYGPYTLLMANGQYREGFSAQKEASEHPFVGADPNVEKMWEQPLYDYTDEGLQYTGYMRITSYQFTRVSVNLGASSTISALVGLLYVGLKKAAVKLGISAAGGPVGEAAGGLLLAADTAIAANNGIQINYQLQVDLKDTRTYLKPAPPCLFNPCWKASP